jgi:hypothetical protein
MVTAISALCGAQEANLNHRWGARRPVALPALVSCPDEGPAVALVTDLSLDGARVTTAGAALVRHQFVTLAFPRGVILTAATVAIPALVVRSADGEAGLMFCGSQSAARSALTSWVLSREQIAPPASRRFRPRYR